MRPMKFAAPALGSIALFGLQAAQAVSPISSPVNHAGIWTSWDIIVAAAVLDAFNLFRNGRIDGGLDDLKQSESFRLERVQDFIVTGENPITCSPAPNAMEKGLLIEVTPEELGTIDMKTVLDKQLKEGLEKLLYPSKPAATPYAEFAANNLAYLSDPAATRVGCGLTKGCQQKGSESGSGANQFLFCIFDDGDTGTPKVSKKFASALKARAAKISIAQLTAKDAHTPLHKGSAAPIVAPSVLAVVVAALSTVLS